MKVLVDADIVSFSCAAYTESWGGDWAACQLAIDELMQRILETTGATNYACFITGSNNFRYSVNPQYKANRKGKPDPIYRADSNAYLVTEYQASVTDGYEADDGIGIEATRLSDEGNDFVIASIDKDLKQIPGNHYNWRKNEFDIITPVDGLRNLYKQSLIGDTSDNIVGVNRIGPVKAEKLLGDVEHEIDMYQICQALYNDDERFLMNMKCLYILREEGKYFEPPQEAE
jgi:5'-3' exonuclease